jgi:hypothetical protein
MQLASLIHFTILSFHWWAKFAVELVVVVFGSLDIPYRVIPDSRRCRVRKGCDEVIILLVRCPSLGFCLVISLIDDSNRPFYDSAIAVSLVCDSWCCRILCDMMNYWCSILRASTRLETPVERVNVTDRAFPVVGNHRLLSLTAVPESDVSTLS